MILKCLLFYYSYYYENLVSVKSMLVYYCIPQSKDYSYDFCSQHCYLLGKSLIRASCLSFLIDEMLYVFP